MDRNRVIGRDGQIPWRLPDDLKRFRRLTSGHAVVMGRRTYESMGRALKDRRNIVITRQRGYAAPGCEVVGSLADGLALAGADAFVIGGGEIYAEALPRAGRLELTYVDTAVGDGTAYFPEIDPSEWREVAREAHPVDERHAFPFTYVTLERMR